MFKPVSLFVGLRYTRTRKRNFLVSFVSVISMLGITLGVLAMIVVLSVINGSTTVMRNETLKSVPHVVISGPDLGEAWQSLATGLLGQPGILAVAPYIEGEAWLRHQGIDRFVTLRGVAPELEAQVMEAASAQLQSQLVEMAGMENGLILGVRLARDLGIFGAQPVSVTPLRSLLGRALDDARTLQAIGAADFGFYGNDSVALVGLDKAAQLFGRQGVNLRLRVSDVFDAAGTVDRALSSIGIARANLRITSWQESQRALFDALRMEKIMTGFMLLMIVIIGAVNIVSTLVMVVADKGADIAILRTMGASRRTVMGIFIIQGTLAGLLGVVLGSLSGVLLATNLGPISRAFENLVNGVFAPDRVYMISYLRAELHWADVGTICAAALLISFLATLYPAWRAARVQPAEVLRYE